MAGQLKINQLQLGDSATATNNFSLEVPSPPDGTLKLARGISGSTTQDVISISDLGDITLPNGLLVIGSVVIASDFSATGITNIYETHVNGISDFNDVTTFFSDATFAQQIISNRAGSTADGNGQIYLNGATSNRIDYNVNGLGAPSMAGRSQGTKINLRPGAFGGTSTDYAIGINSSTLWFSTSTTTADFRFYGGNATAALITGDGNFTIVGATATKASGTTWANPSDRRLKENIQDYTKGINELNQLKIHTWQYNGYANTTKGLKGMGVIADEIAEVLPETIGTYLETLPNEVEPLEFKKVDSSEITWLLVKAVQELSAQVISLQQQVSSLQTNIASPS
jgi:hypothetical protein